MADVNDISTSIAAALTEVGVTAKLDVTTDDEHAVAIIGAPGGGDVQVDVMVKPAE